MTVPEHGAPVMVGDPEGFRPLHLGLGKAVLAKSLGLPTGLNGRQNSRWPRLERIACRNRVSAGRCARAWAGESFGDGHGPASDQDEVCSRQRPAAGSGKF